MDLPVKEALGALATVSAALLAYRQWKRTKRSGTFIEDRQTAYKTVWQGVEEVHLFVRFEAFRQERFDDLVNEADTLLTRHSLHIAEADQRLGKAYVRALRRFAKVVSQRQSDLSDATERFALDRTDEGRQLEFAREELIAGFRRAIGADQI